MKKKGRKQRKRRQSARHAAPGVHATRRHRIEQNKTDTASVPWLRMIPTFTEDDSPTNVSRGSLFARNGRRHFPDFDLYLPEQNSRTR
jgi:hypothetical protein